MTKSGVTASDTRYIRAGFLPIQERDASNSVIREYLWGKDLGGGIGGLLNLRQGGKDYNYLYDGKGNVSALFDVSANTVATTYTYDPFGVLMKKTGTLDQPFQFSTKPYDAETGLVYYGERFYMPNIGKWLTRDPLGENGGINLYQMVRNNPVNYVDPDGNLPAFIAAPLYFVGAKVLAYATAYFGTWGANAIVEKATERSMPDAELSKTMTRVRMVQECGAETAGAHLLWNLSLQSSGAHWIMNKFFHSQRNQLILESAIEAGTVINTGYGNFYGGNERKGVSLGNELFYARPRF